MDEEVPHVLPMAVMLTQEYSHEFVCNSEVDYWISLLYGSTKYNDQNLASSSPTHDVSQSHIKARNESELAEANPGKNKAKLVARNNNKANIPPRVAFHTKSVDDILDDGYRWRKYGHKSLKNNVHPRSYYRCCHHTCNVKKQIQRHSKDSSVVVTTYEGIHNHPCEKLMESLSPLLKQLQLQFLSSFQNIIEPGQQSQHIYLSIT